jgi:hypothetical protein
MVMRELGGLKPERKGFVGLSTSCFLTATCSMRLDSQARERDSDLKMSRLATSFSFPVLFCLVQWGLVSRTWQLKPRQPLNSQLSKHKEKEWNIRQ